MAVSFWLPKIPAATAFSRVFSKSLASASAATMRARIKLKVVGAMPPKSSSTPMAAFQSRSTRVLRAISASERTRS